MADKLRAAAGAAIRDLEFFQPDACKETIADLRAALAEPECGCDLRTQLVGDGCEVCNPELASALAEKDAEPVDDVWFEDRNGASRKSPKDCQRFGANGVPEAVWVNGNRYTRRSWASLTEGEEP